MQLPSFWLKLMQWCTGYGIDQYSGDGCHSLLKAGEPLARVARVDGRQVDGTPSTSGFFCCDPSHSAYNYLSCTTKTCSQMFQHAGLAPELLC